MREEQSKKWTPQQIIYLRSLFYTTEMLMVGKVQVIQRDDGGKKVVIKEGKAAIKSCTDQQRTKVKDSGGGIHQGRARIFRKVRGAGPTTGRSKANSANRRTKLPWLPTS